MRSREIIQVHTQRGKILRYIQNDMRLIFRDPILYIMLFVPLIFIALLRIGLPALIGIFPAVEPYSRLLLGTFCLVTAVFPAFIYSFIIKWTIGY